MACSSCAKTSFNSGMQMNNFNKPQRQMETLSHNDFVLMEYIGSTGQVNSVIPAINYGYKKHGSVMHVHVKDVEDQSELWQEIVKEENIDE